MCLVCVVVLFVEWCGLICCVYVVCRVVFKFEFVFVVLLFVVCWLSFVLVCVDVRSSLVFSSFL